MSSIKKIRLVISLMSFVAIVAPFMYLLGQADTQAAFEANSRWLIYYTLFWVALMSLLLMRNRRFFGDETPFDILVRKTKGLIDWLRVKD